MRPISDTQPIMERIFPNLIDYPMNVFITSVVKQFDGTPTISLLAIIDDVSIINIKNSGDSVPIEICTFTEDNPNGFGKDFFLRLTFFYNSESVNYDAVISANDQMHQMDFLQDLMKVDKIHVWFANRFRKVERIITVDLDSQANSAISAILNDIDAFH